MHSKLIEKFHVTRRILQHFIQLHFKIYSIRIWNFFYFVSIDFKRGSLLTGYRSHCVIIGIFQEFLVIFFLFKKKMLRKCGRNKISLRYSDKNSLDIFLIHFVHLHAFRKTHGTHLQHTTSTI